MTTKQVRGDIKFYMNKAQIGQVIYFEIFYVIHR